MLRIGVGPIAATAFAIGFIFCLWLTTDPAPGNAGLRAEGQAVSGPGTVDRKLATVGPGVRDGFRARWASLPAEGASKFTFDERDDQAEPRSARTSFGERFAFEQVDEPTGSLQRSASFDDRFVNEFKAPGATTRSAAVAPAKVQRVAAAAATPRAAARPAVAQATSKRPQDGRFQLASASATSLPLSYAPTDPVKGSKPLADADTSRTAIYDITSQTVYLPNGRRLEAHSGLGDHMDDPRYVNMKMTGPTPPNVYDLKMREAPFRGVRALRLVPTDNSKMYGRAGILAHSYLLGPSGASNGCVSFSDYDAFLDAFQRGEINRLVVVERLADPPSPRTASGLVQGFLPAILKQDRS